MNANTRLIQILFISDFIRVPATYIQLTMAFIFTSLPTVIDITNIGTVYHSAVNIEVLNIG